jgi:hypothetical protein
LLDKWSPVFKAGYSFWTAQNAAVAARADPYRAAGWREVVIVGPDTPFQSWEHEKCGRRKGGRIYIVVRRTGEVVFHEGYIPRREAKRLREGGADTAPAAAPIIAAISVVSGTCCRRDVQVTTSPPDRDEIATPAPVPDALVTERRSPALWTTGRTRRAPVRSTRSAKGP